MEGSPKLFIIFNVSRGSTLADRVRLAGNSAERRRGLLGTTSLPIGAGLWIAPCEAIHTFGMKVAIDSIFLDKHLRVRKVLANLPRRRIALCLLAHSVLELPAGTVARSGTLCGDQLEYADAALHAAVSTDDAVAPTAS